MLNFKWTVVDLLLQDKKYISSLICLIWLVSDGFTLVQIRNEWNSDQPFLFYLGAWRAHLYCKWKLESMLRDVIIITAKGNASRTFYIVSKEASFYVAPKATANPPSRLWELKPGRVVLLTVGNSRQRDFSWQSKFRHLACLRFGNQPFRHLNSVPDVSQSFVKGSYYTTDME